MDTAIDAGPAARMWGSPGAAFDGISFGLSDAHWSDAPPPAASPFDWGRPDWLEAAMAGLFEIACREQTTLLYAPDPATVWEEYLRGFGPVAATYAALPVERRSGFRANFEALHRPYETDVGLVINRNRPAGPRCPCLSSTPRSHLGGEEPQNRLGRSNSGTNT